MFGCDIDADSPRYRALGEPKPPPIESPVLGR
jgi:hypothetical protein